jgi:hypothetical protein
VVVILAVHGKESIPAKVLSLHGANRLAIVQQGDVGALSLDETYTELLATLDEGTRACFGSSGLNEIITGKPLGQFPDRFPFKKILNEITTGKSAGQFPDGFPFMRGSFRRAKCQQTATAFWNYAKQWEPYPKKNFQGSKRQVTFSWTL